MTTNRKKFTAENFFWDQKLQFSYSYAFIQDVYAIEEPSALKRELSGLQDMKFLNFFLLFWVIFALLDPDPPI
jgi:hypothetical protein